MVAYFGPEVRANRPETDTLAEAGGRSARIRPVEVPWLPVSGRKPEPTSLNQTGRSGREADRLESDWSRCLGCVFRAGSPSQPARNRHPGRAGRPTCPNQTGRGALVAYFGPEARANRPESDTPAHAGAGGQPTTKQGGSGQPGRRPASSLSVDMPLGSSSHPACALRPAPRTPRRPTSPRPPPRRAGCAGTRARRPSCRPPGGPCPPSRRGHAAAAHTSCRRWPHP